MPRQSSPRLVVIGLDGAVPQLVFDRFRSSLPNLAALCNQAIIGDLETVTPAFSIPAWPSLFTGRDPGQLGVYGPRQRLDHAYGPERPVSSRLIAPPFLWDLAGQAGKQSIVIGVPPSVPLRPIEGTVVGCSLLPDHCDLYTAPPELSARLTQETGVFLPDLRGIEHEPAERALEKARAVTVQRFAHVHTLMNDDAWQLAVVVDPTIDRLQHAFWRNPEVIRAHYAVIDAEVGRLVASLSKEDIIAVVSDHGGKPSRGSFAVNDWLIREGYLKVKALPAHVTSLDQVDVDWPATQAWADGGQVVRVVLNVKGREPQGYIEAREYEVVRNKLKRQLELLHGPDGKTLSVQVHKPEEIYQSIHRVAPDLLAVIGGMNWRASGNVGHNDLFHAPVDGLSTGNHAEHGLFILRWPKHGPIGRRQSIRLLDMFPTFLNVLGLPAVAGLPGHALIA